MNITLETHHFVEILKKSYSLDHIFLLKLITEEVDIEEICNQSIKISSLYQGLLRKGLITEKGISPIGLELLAFLETKGEEKIPKKKSTIDELELWWKTFPGTDTFVHNGISFIGSRTLRNGRENCRIKFNKILLENEYTSTQLVEALSFDVLQKKEASLKEKTNKLKYMQNSLTYLNQRSYESFIELIQQGVENGKIITEIIPTNIKNLFE